ncbi:diphthamide biosynthesis protein 2 isoform X1 [Iris pallida]|uniref:2-(3-amino-3-carboxypropyl)histidine synthase subunit 2 n=1 Tax=Iris pallida TaxID=29817 RepID=A0AAX6FNH4_IRIPA|nr:diphthamide biosynthesis protein 2 isoform X1 [Iris pallida]
MDFESKYEIARTADFIRSRSFTRVALQFPDELLEDSTRVAKALRAELGRGARLFVMADTAFGSCCVDEVGASHVDADCVVHYGHSCMSPTSKLPALLVFGKASVDVNACAESLVNCLTTSKKPILVLFGLEYAHTLQSIKSVVAESLHLDYSKTTISYAEVTCSIINPLEDVNTESKQLQSLSGFSSNEVSSNGETKTVHKSDQCCGLKLGTRHGIGGLTWSMPAGHKMEDYLLFWIGSDDQAFANLVLTFNTYEIVRYDAKEAKLLKDFSHQKRILKRRYYLVEKAKDANIVGILLGTLGVAGYLHIINQMKALIEGAGKKTYILVMGRPNAAKLANFPECDIFVYVSCAQTALLDSKEFLAPVITPFEAMLAFTRGRQWTGEYVMSFSDLLGSTSLEAVGGIDEARFSFLQGGYMEDIPSQETETRKPKHPSLWQRLQRKLWI